MSQAKGEQLEWSSKFTLGHPTIDAQHQRLFELYGLVCDAFNEGTGPQIIQKTVEDLVSYTRQHFQDEEQLMAKAGYEGLSEHRDMHQKLLSEVDFFVGELEADKPVLIYEVLGFLREWLIDHILNEDMNIRVAGFERRHKPN